MLTRAPLFYTLGRLPIRIRSVIFLLIRIRIKREGVVPVGQVSTISPKAPESMPSYLHDQNQRFQPLRSADPRQGS